MSRHIQAFTSPLPKESVLAIFNDLVAADGYHKRALNGEDVFFKSGGLMFSPQFAKLVWRGDVFIIEAWTAYALLPNVYVNEMDLDGFFGFPAKSNLKNLINSLYYNVKASVVSLPSVDADC